MEKLDILGKTDLSRKGSEERALGKDPLRSSGANLNIAANSLRKARRNSSN
jgi:hypothetical protein